MAQTLIEKSYFSEADLFSPCMQAGEFTFTAQDARGPDGTVGTAQSAERQAAQSLVNLDTALQTFGQSTADVINLTVYLSEYAMPLR